jgi:hypothetical protein
MRIWIIALTALAVLALTPDASHARATGAPASHLLAI